MLKDFSKLCTPAKIYFAIAVISSVIALFNGLGLLLVGVKLVFALLWTVVLGWLCEKGFKTLSWVLVLLPYIMIALAMFGVYHMSPQHKQLLKAIRLQGAFGQEGMAVHDPKKVK